MNFQTLIESREISVPREVELTIEHHIDETPDFSHMGYFSAKWESGAIDRIAAGENIGRNEYQYWIPTPGCMNWDEYQIYSENWYTENGYNKHDATMSANKHRMQDYNRIRGLINDSWWYIGIVVKTPWNTESSVWGIESDCTEFIKETEQDLISELLSQKQIKITIG